MSSFESVYVLDDSEGGKTFGPLVLLLEELREMAYVRSVKGGPWIQVSRQGFGNGPVSGGIRSTLRAFDSLESLTDSQERARNLSRILEVETLSLEVVTTVDHVSFARYRSGVEHRRFIYCPEGDGWEVDVGTREQWEDADGDLGPTGREVGQALGLPGFLNEQSTEREACTCGAVKPRAAPPSPTYPKFPPPAATR